MNVEVNLQVAEELMVSKCRCIGNVHAKLKFVVMLKVKAVRGRAVLRASMSATGWDRGRGGGGVGGGQGIGGRGAWLTIGGGWMGVFVKVVKMMFVSLADFSLTETTMPRFRTSPPLGLFKVYSARGSRVAVECRVVWFCVVVHSSVVLCGLVWSGVVWLCCGVLWSAVV